MIADSLIDQVDTLFDLTVGYSGLTGDQIPYEEYLADKVFFKQHYPKQVHIHVKMFSLKTLPGLNTSDTGSSSIPPIKKDSSGKVDQMGSTFDTACNNRRLLFADWVKKQFMEKDERMKLFYEKGSFEGVAVVKPIRPELEDWVIVIGIMLSSWVIVPFGWRAFSACLSFSYHLMY